jgi:hypothetical protein
VYVSPAQSNPISGTDVRNNLGKNVDDDTKMDFFSKRAYPKFNKKIYDLITKKLSESYEPLFISKEVIEEWVATKLSDILKESNTTTTSGGDVDDGPNFFFPNYDVYSNISEKRAQQIGYTVFKQIMDKKYEDYYEHPTYPKGPVKAVTPFPAGVIGKTTATNQKDITTSRAYDLWFAHVTRSMALAGYSLVRAKDEIEKRLATKNLKSYNSMIKNYILTARRLAKSGVLFAAMFSLLGVAKAQLSGTVTVGSGGTYSDLSALASAIASNGIGTGGLTANLVSNITQTGRVTFKQNSTNPATSAKPITIDGKNYTVTSSITNDAGIVFDGSTVPTEGTATAAIEQSRMDSLLDGVWDNSGDINSAKIMASAGVVSSLRNTLSGMATNADSVVSNLDANATSGGNIIARVAVYVSQFGPIAVVPNKHMPANTLYVVDYSTWGLAFAGGKKIHTTDIATQTSAEQKLLECYYTLEARSEEANAAYYNIA